jgi:hypothetical protein
MIDNKESLVDIRNRFEKESESIKKYIDFMEENTSLPEWRNIDNIFKILLKFKIYTDSYDEEENENIYLSTPSLILETLKKYYLMLPSKIEEIKGTANEILMHGIIENVKKDDTIESVLTYVTMGYEEIEEPIQTLEELGRYFDKEIKSLLDFQKIHNMDFVDEYNEKVSRGEDKYIKNTFLYKVIIEEIDALEYVSEEIGQAEILFNMNNEKNILNIYRQGFILLVAGFDAVVFDMVKLLMNNRFFEYIDKLYNKDKNMKMRDLSNYENFNEFKDNIVNEGLKGKYIKDLVEILKDLGVDYIVQNFSTLMECLNRRNIHLHNQGKVDKKYMEKFNIHSLSENEIAKIDRDYFENTYRLCLGTVNSIYEWVNTVL